MNGEHAQSLRPLLHDLQVASLGTLHDHTRDMVENPRVSLLVVATVTAGTSAQAVARVAILGEAEPWPESAPGWAVARDAYLARFPGSADTFELTDVSLFAMRPT